jgi:hypothetical protein
MESAVSLTMLSGFIWVVAFLLPKARREHDVFGIICSLVMAFVALVGWLLIGTGAHSG